MTMCILIGIDYHHITAWHKTRCHYQHRQYKCYKAHTFKVIKTDVENQILSLEPDIGVFHINMCFGTKWISL